MMKCLKKKVMKFINWNNHILYKLQKFRNKKTFKFRKLNNKMLKIILKMKTNYRKN